MPDSSTNAEARAEIQRSLGRIEGKLDSLVNTVAFHVVEDKTNFSDIHNRMRNLEIRVYSMAGFITAGTWVFQHYFK